MVQWSGMDEKVDKADLFESVAETITRQELICEGERVLVAVSGGADSTALLSLLHKLSSRFGAELAVGHFDHRLRETSFVDRRAVEMSAASLGLPFYSGEGDVRARAEEHGETIEEASRKLRYQYLSSVADDIRADRLATGHTRDDQIETVLMRILRGTGTRGLTGIPARNGRLIRPLLGLAHLQLVNYCRKHHLPFIEDPSNRDKRFTRNWLRYELLPSIRKYYPNVGDNLLRLSRNAADSVGRIRDFTNQLIEKNLRRESTARMENTGGAADAEMWVLDLDGIDVLDQEAKYILFGDLLAEHLGHDPDYTRVHFEKLARLCGSAAESGEQLSIPGLTVRREFDSLVFIPGDGRFPSNTPPLPPVTLPVPGVTMFGETRIKTEVLPMEQPETFDPAKYQPTESKILDSSGNREPAVAYFAATEIGQPLVVRTHCAGDRMCPFGMKGSKKLSDIFIDNKIPLRRREQALVITDPSDILWLVGVMTAEKTRISASTGKIVKISIEAE